MARKVLTRAESQAQTRQELLNAAEQMFHANGYHATSLAAIAAEAGRTIGAVYSNFASKEALCLEVLRGRFLAEAAKLLQILMGVGASVDARLEALSRWWSTLAGETSLLVLTAEYLISTVNDEGQTAANREVIERFKETSRALLEDTLGESASPSDPRINDALDTAISTGMGLAITQAMGVIDAERGGELMATSLRLWLEELS